MGLSCRQADGPRARQVAVEIITPSLHGPPIFPFDEPPSGLVAKLPDLVMPRLAYAALRRGSLGERAYCLA